MASLVCNVMKGTLSLMCDSLVCVSVQQLTRASAKATCPGPSQVIGGPAPPRPTRGGAAGASSGFGKVSFSKSVNLLLSKLPWMWAISAGHQNHSEALQVLFLQVNLLQVKVAHFEH